MATEAREAAIIETTPERALDLFKVAFVSPQSRIPINFEQGTLIFRAGGLALPQGDPDGVVDYLCTCQKVNVRPFSCSVKRFSPDFMGFATVFDPDYNISEPSLNVGPSSRALLRAAGDLELQGGRDHVVIYVWGKKQPEPVGFRYLIEVLVPKVLETAYIPSLVDVDTGKPQRNVAFQTTAYDAKLTVGSEDPRDYLYIWLQNVQDVFGSLYGKNTFSLRTHPGLQRTVEYRLLGLTPQLRQIMQS